MAVFLVVFFVDFLVVFFVDFFVDFLVVFFVDFFVVFLDDFFFGSVVGISMPSASANWEYTKPSGVIPSMDASMTASW